MAEEIEIWKPIPDYENYYEISNLGRIRSKGRTFQRLKYLHIYKAKILSLVKQKAHPYLIIRLNNGIITKGYLVHRLVALTFLPNPLGKKEVNHLDGNTKNNKVSNLEWCTSSENVLYSFKLRKISRKGTLNHSSKITETDVQDIRILLKSGYSNVYIASIFKVTPTSISHIKTGKQWNHVK